MRIRSIDPGTRSYGVVDLDERGRVLLAVSGAGPEVLLGLPPADVWAVEAVESYGRIRAAQLVALAESAGAALHQCRLDSARLAGRPRRRDVLASLGIPAGLPAAIADAQLLQQLRARGIVAPDTHTADAAGVALWALRAMR